MKRNYRPWIVALFVLSGVAGGALLYFSSQHPAVSNSHISEIPPAVSSPRKPVPSSAPIVNSNWPRWGGALNSAEQAGAGFFDRKKAREFSASVDAAERKYIIELNARALLPLTGEDALDTIFGADTAPRTAYLQCFEHPTPAQRQALADVGIALLSYSAGYAWTARGSRESFAAALALPFVRAAAALDGRDKMHALVFAGKIPDYATAADGSARLMLIGAPGTGAETLRDALAKSPALSQRPSRVATPSVLGERVELAADIHLAPEIAALDAVAYVGLVPPPMGQRDAITDTESNVSDVRDAPSNLTGAGVKVALRELGRMDAHADFASRLTYIENDASTGPSNSAHATAVTGVIGSDGSTQPTAKGVAPGVNMLAYSVTGDDAFTTADVRDAVARGVRISNHSYGPDGLSVWGDYQPESADWDDAIRKNGLVVVAAGNEEVGGLFKHIDFFVGSKNTICVGASNSSARAEDANDAPPVAKADGLASYTEFGPMQDGRVKPDLVAFGGDGSGTGVTLDLGTNATQSNSGTSFSTPAVTGIAALVFQQYKTVFGLEPSAALTKAILCNTACDLGTPGPDAKYGFGIANAEQAIAAINLKQNSANSPFLEDVVDNSATKQYSIDVQNMSELRITLCWMDVAGSPSVSKALVNDLDLELIAPDASKVFPFSLDPNNPSNAATATGPNSVDPIEQIVVANPMNGVWKINVSGASIPGGSQAFAVCCNASLLPLTVGISASPDSGPAPLSVMFSGQQGGTANDYKWDFGDGTIEQGADKFQVSHSYMTAGAYTTTLTVNGAASATKVVIVTKKLSNVVASKGSLKLDYRGSEGASDDTFQFTLTSTDLARPAAQAKLDLPQFAGQSFTVRAGGTADGTMPTTKITTITLDTKGMLRSLSTNFKLNLAKGTMQVQFKKTALEKIFAAIGMTRDPASSNFYEVPVEIENDTTIFRGVLRMDYKNKTGTSGSARGI
jgi:PKD repeat protein